MELAVRGPAYRCALIWVYAVAAAAMMRVSSAPRAQKEGRLGGGPLTLIQKLIMIMLVLAADDLAGAYGPSEASSVIEPSFDRLGYGHRGSTAL
jgi:hypothetical protein